METENEQMDLEYNVTILENISQGGTSPGNGSDQGTSHSSFCIASSGLPSICPTTRQFPDQDKRVLRRWWDTYGSDTGPHHVRELTGTWRVTFMAAVVCVSAADALWVTQKISSAHGRIPRASLPVGKLQHPRSPSPRCACFPTWSHLLWKSLKVIGRCPERTED